MKNMILQKCVVGDVGTNCYLAMHRQTRELLIIDPGDRADLLIRQIRQMEGVPQAILLTHGHFDHILAAEELRSTFSIPAAAYETEKEMLADGKYNMSCEYGCPVEIVPDLLLTQDQEITLASFRIRCIHTPGHTPGSCCYYLPEEEILFSGDTLFKGSVGRTDFPGGSFSQIQDSLHRLLETLPEDTVVYPGHEGMTTIRIEKETNPFV